MVEKIQTQIIYPLKNPKKNPNNVSNFPRPENFTALLIPLLIIRIRNITTMNIPTPKTISKIYSLSITSFRLGFIFGNKINVITYAKSHFAASRTLKTNPFLEHLIKDNNVIIK